MLFLIEYGGGDNFRFFFSTRSFHFAIFLMKNASCLYMGSIHAVDKSLYQNRYKE